LLLNELLSGLLLKKNAPKGLFLEKCAEFSIKKLTGLILNHTPSIS
jgi:hypothetical protein